MSYMSRSEHEKFWLNMGGPPSKAKYSYQTDSAQVPWGKGEKNPGEGSEIEPETVCLQSLGGVSENRKQKTENGVKL